MLCRGRKVIGSLTREILEDVFSFVSVVSCDGNQKGKIEKPGGLELSYVLSRQPWQGTKGMQGPRKHWRGEEPCRERLGAASSG